MLTRYRSLFEPAFAAVGRALVAARVTPTGITWTGLVLQVAGAVLIADHRLVLGSAVWGLGAVLDAMDGTLARMTGRVSLVGGFLDSVLDRYGDATILLAVGWHYDTAWVWAACVLALLGSTATSYAKARTYQDVHPPTDAWPDLLERPERGLLMGFLTGFQGLSDVGFWPGPLQAQFLPWVVVGLAVLTNLTVVQRSRRAVRYLNEAEAR